MTNRRVYARILTAYAWMLALSACSTDIGTMDAGRDTRAASDAIEASSPSDTPAGDSLDATSNDVPMDAGVDRDATVSVDVRTSDDGIADADTVNPDAGCTTTRTRDMWVSEATTAIDATERAALLAFIDRKLIRTVFFNPARLLDTSSGQDQLAAYVRALNARCVRVEFLYGNSAWSTMDTMTVQTRARLAVAFVRRFPDVRVEALHFDIEPHLDAMWSSDRNTTANLYLDALTALGPIARGAGMRMVVDITHWYWTINVTRSGRTAPLDTFLIPLVDRFVIMNYWGTPDTAATNARLISQVQHEATTARMFGREWESGLNVITKGPPDETFAGEGESAVLSAIAALEGEYRGTPGYVGIAIYDYLGYRVLRP